jgi:hypothetical protein
MCASIRLSCMEALLVLRKHACMNLWQIDLRARVIYRSLFEYLYIYFDNVHDFDLFVFMSDDIVLQYQRLTLDCALIDQLILEDLRSFLFSCLLELISWKTSWWNHKLILQWVLFLRGKKRKCSCYHLFSLSRNMYVNLK